jgi:integral membrane protein
VSTASPKALHSALLRYRVMAYVTGVLLATMTVIAVWVHVVMGGTAPVWYGIGWMMHGYAYLLYVATALDLAFRMRWNLLRVLLVVLAGTIPFMSFVAERKVTHSVEQRTAALPGAALPVGNP